MKRTEAVSILFCGIGGQGVLKASEICGLAAVFEGQSVKKTEVHGMAQRGGSVESHLRFGRQVWSPLIVRGQADFLVCVHPDEYARRKAYLKADGIAFMKELPAGAAHLGDRRYINTFLLGALSRHLTLERASWLQALEAVFSGTALAENKKAFLLGRGETP